MFVAMCQKVTALRLMYCRWQMVILASLFYSDKYVNHSFGSKSLVPGIVGTLVWDIFCFGQSHNIPR